MSQASNIKKICLHISFRLWQQHVNFVMYYKLDGRVSESKLHPG